MDLSKIPGKPSPPSVPPSVPPSAPPSTPATPVSSPPPPPHPPLDTQIGSSPSADAPTPPATAGPTGSDAAFPQQVVPGRIGRKRGDVGVGDGPWISSPEAMLHLGIAVVIGLMVSNAFRWIVSLAGLAEPPPNAIVNATGQVIPYAQSLYFIHDGPIAMLALGMALEAVAVGVLLSRGLAWVAVGWLTMSTAACAWAFLRLQSAGQGLQIMPLVAAIVGAYTAWTLVTKLREG